MNSQKTAMHLFCTALFYVAILSSHPVVVVAQRDRHSGGSSVSPSLRSVSINRAIESSPKGDDVNPFRKMSSGSDKLTFEKNNKGTWHYPESISREGGENNTQLRNVKTLSPPASFSPSEKTPQSVKSSSPSPTAPLSSIPTESLSVSLSPVSPSSPASPVNSKHTFYSRFNTGSAKSNDVKSRAPSPDIINVKTKAQNWGKPVNSDFVTKAVHVPSHDKINVKTKAQNWQNTNKAFVPKERAVGKLVDERWKHEEYQVTKNTNYRKPQINFNEIKKGWEDKNLQNDQSNKFEAPKRKLKSNWLKKH